LTINDIVVSVRSLFAILHHSAGFNFMALNNFHAPKPATMASDMSNPPSTGAVVELI
jgi:hypothetical protein